VARDPVSGFVICASCGARIKADRSRCLRCGELLEPAASAGRAAATPPLREWLKTSPPRSVSVIAIGAVALVVGGIAYTKLDSTPDNVAQPAKATAPKNLPPAATPTTRSTASHDMLYPPAPVDSVRLAGAAFTAGDLASAKTRYQEALRNKPEDPEALNGLGLILEREGAVDDAIAHFMRAAAAVPSKWAYRFNLAHAWGERGNWDAAVEEYRAAAGLFPDDYATLYNLALAMHKKGDDEAAIPEFRKAIAMAPREPTFHLSLAKSLEKTGKLADAQHEYQQYLDKMPWAPEVEKLREHVKELASGKSN
jgi:tetratricopeptide (TPR) repeat protein